MSSNHIQHVNLMVDDLDAAVEFYTGVLGLDRASTPDLGFPAQFIAINDVQEIHLNELEDTRGTRSHFAIRVDDFSAIFRRAKDAGVIESATWGLAKRLGNGVLQMFVRDPSGNLVEIAADADQAIDDDVLADTSVFADAPR